MAVRLPRRKSQIRRARTAGVCSSLSSSVRQTPPLWSIGDGLASFRGAVGITLPDRVKNGSVLFGIAPLRALRRELSPSLPQTTWPRLACMVSNSSNSRALLAALAIAQWNRISQKPHSLQSFVVPIFLRQPSISPTSRAVARKAASRATSGSSASRTSITSRGFVSSERSFGVMGEGRRPKKVPFPTCRQMRPSTASLFRLPRNRLRVSPS